MPIETFGDIDFAQNWNRKLQCKFFTTIRLANTAKYHVGRAYRIIIHNDYYIDGKIVAIRYCKLDELPEYTCYQDTGYNKPETIALIKKMYSKKNIDWSKQLVSIILLEHLQWERPN